MALSEDQQMIAASYHDNCWTHELETMIGSKDELLRLNEYRDTNWTQQELDDVICEAIRMRRESGQK